MLKIIAVDRLGSKSDDNRLPTEYKEALKAFKDQAAVAEKMLLLRFTNKPQSTDKKNMKKLREVLSEVHCRMKKYDSECNVIAKLLRTSNDDTLTIKTLDEQRLYFLLLDRQELNQ